MHDVQLSEVKAPEAFIAASATNDQPAAFLAALTDKGKAVDLVQWMAKASGSSGIVDKAEKQEAAWWMAMGVKTQGQTGASSLFAAYVISERLVANAASAANRPSESSGRCLVFSSKPENVMTLSYGKEPTTSSGILASARSGPMVASDSDVRWASYV